MKATLRVRVTMRLGIGFAGAPCPTLTSMLECLPQARRDGMAGHAMT